MGEKIPTAVPDRVFDEDMTITLGGETVQLHRVAPSHSDSMIMVLFPKYRALQCTDVYEAKSIPYNDFLDFYYPGWIETLDWVLKQNVDVIDIGHYSPGTNEIAIAARSLFVPGLVKRAAKTIPPTNIGRNRVMDPKRTKRLAGPPTIQRTHSSKNGTIGSLRRGSHLAKWSYASANVRFGWKADGRVLRLAIE